MKVSLERFSDAVAQIHEAAAAPQQWCQALAAIMSLVDGTRASLLEIEPTGALSSLTQIGHDAETAREYVRDFYAIDPTRELVMRVPPLRAIASYDIFAAGYRNRHPYFEFARRVDIGDVVGLHCPSAQNRKSVLGVQRAFHAKRYGAEEKQTLELLARHISIARRVEGQLSDAWTGAAQMEAAFAALSCAALVIDGSGAVRHANPAAEALLGRGEGIGVRHGKVRFTDPATQARFLRAVRAAVAESCHSSAQPLVLAGGKAAELLIAPLRPNNPRATNWQVPLALAIISVEAIDTASIAWRLRQVYGLTQAEARVASLLAVGKNLQDIARASGVTEPTLRTHLRSIFGKTGTRRQAELVVAALRGGILER